MTQIQATLQAAIQHHRAGALAQAEHLYRQILAIDPHPPRQRKLLGERAGLCQARKPKPFVDALTAASDGEGPILGPHGTTR